MRTSRSAVMALMILTVGVVLVRLLPPAMASGGHVYYVSPDGSNSNPGTIEQPWGTLTDTLGDLKPGDTLYVRGGTYQERVIPGTLAKGTESAPIIVQAYPGEVPVVEGLFWLNEPTYWTLDGINVTWDPANSLDEHMVKLKGGDHWVWKNAEVWGSQSDANILVSMANDEVTPPNDWTIQDNCIHDNVGIDSPHDHNIYVGDIHGSVGGLITNNLLFNAANGQGIKLGPPDDIDGPTGVTVAYNTIYNTGRHSILVGSASNNIRVEYNLIGDTHLDSGNSTIIGNNTQSGFVNNVLSSNAWFQADMFMNYYPQPPASAFLDLGGEVNVDPKFDETADCNGFHPLDEQSQAYGRYAGQGPLPTPSPSPSPSPSPTPSPSPSPTESFSPSPSPSASESFSPSPSPSPTLPSPQPIEFRSASSGANASETTLSLAKPTGVVAGDVLVAALSIRGKPTITAPPDWTLIRSDVNGKAMTQAAYYHVAGSSEQSTSVWTFEKAHAAAGAILAYSGVSGTAPIMASSAQITSSSTSITAPSVTAAVAGAMLIGLFGEAKDTTISPPVDMTAGPSAASTSGTFKVVFDCSFALKSGSGSTGTEVAVGGKSGGNVGQLIALTPASA